MGWSALLSSFGSNYESHSGEIGRASGLSMPDVHHILGWLHEMGAVSEQSSPFPGRRRHYQLTADGLEMAGSAIEADGPLVLIHASRV